MESDPQQIEELKELVRQNIALSQETNKMIHSMRTSAWVSRGIRALWVLGIIAISVYSYLYFQPYLNQILGFYGNLQALQQKASTVLSTFGSPSSTTTQSH